MGSELSTSSQLCQSCGLCCDGSLFAWVLVDKDEEQTKSTMMRLAGKTDADCSRLKLPCMGFSCGTCQIYQDRPKRCQNYECVVLKKMEIGSISLEGARNMVQEALALKREFLRAAQSADFEFSDLSGHEINSSLINLSKSETSPQRRKALFTTTVKYYSFNKHLDENFRLPKQAK